MGTNEKNQFAYSLRNVDWRPLYAMKTCKDQFNYFHSTMQGLIEAHFPTKTIHVHTKDKPWISNVFKTLVKQRAQARKDGNDKRYKTLRNKVTHLNKKLREQFYKLKMKSLEKGDSKSWWKHVKAITQLEKGNNDDHFQAVANEIAEGDTKDLVDKINDFFYSVSKDLPPLRKRRTEPLDIPSRMSITTSQVEDLLFKVKANKAPGPDDIQPWMLRDFSSYLAPPLASIFNSSIRDSYIPDIWKQANVCPIPKKYPVKDITKDIRPISLTSILAKILEKHIINILKYELEGKDGPLQFGNKKGVSTTHMLIELTHKWMEALDNNKTIRILFLDFSKAFDRVDHQILMDKFKSLGVSMPLYNWIYAFLTDRTQRVKIRELISELKTLNGAIPQGALMGMEAFIRMIDDLKSRLPIYKYVDDSSTFEITEREQHNSSLQLAVNEIVEWTKKNNMIINTDKTYEMVISSSKTPTNLAPITIDDKIIKRVTSTKLVGVIIQNDLKWTEQITNMISKARSRLYFLTQLKRAKAEEKDLLVFYKSIVRPHLEYSSQTWSSGITQTQSENIERVQRRALRIIYPDEDSVSALRKSGLQTLQERRTKFSKKLFLEMQNENHVLNKLLPRKNDINMRRRHTTKYPLPQVNSNRFKNSFLPHSLFNFQ